uniref:tRNA (guanine(26)-N(2))-dimethyltransferase n=1 Tax=Chaetoceros debilis TaxID=122233 RepID=A0A7S3Q1S8_9STRA
MAFRLHRSVNSISRRLVGYKRVLTTAPPQQRNLSFNRSNIHRLQKPVFATRLTSSMTGETPTTETAATTSTSADDVIPENRELIVEGSAKMLYPKGVVFYNPVQVQNRDLSLLMLQLYAERRVKRIQLKKQKKIFLKEAREKIGSAATNEEAIRTTNKIDMKAIEQQLKEYEEKTNWTEHYDSYDGKGIRVLDALAASGLRSLRYFNEMSPSLLHSVTINDLDPAAADLAKENIDYNKLSDHLLEGDEEDKKRGISVVNSDATHLMYTSRRKPDLYNPDPIQAMQKIQYDVIDLDPYGSAAPFLDPALQAVSNGGLLAITSTDMAALGGSHPDTCYGRYSSMPIPRAPYLQELALRILLKEVATRAAVYGRYIRPVLSVGMAFYVRVFVEVWDDKAAVNNMSLDIGTVYQSAQCPSFHTIPHGQHSRNNKNIIQATRAPKYPVCEETGAEFKTAGPMWMGPLHNKDVVGEAITRLEELEAKTGEAKDVNQLFGYMKMHRELHGLLTSVSEELDDVPLYYDLSNLSHTMGSTSPQIGVFKSAIINAGFRVSGYHKEPQAIKTDAPNSVIWDIMRAWCKEHPPKLKSKKKQNRLNKKKRIKNNKGQWEAVEDSGKANEIESPIIVSAAEKILAKESSITVDFTLSAEIKNKKKALRFPMNPEANWGPKKAASGYKRKSEESNDS